MKLRIRTVLLSAFLVASIAPLAFFWLWPHSLAITKKVEEVRERHLLLAQNLSLALEVYYRDLVTAFESFAPMIAAGEGEAGRALLSNLHFRHICAVDATSGRLITGFAIDDVACPEQLSESALKAAQEVAREAGNGVNVSPVLKESEGAPPYMLLVKASGERLVVGAISTAFFRKVQGTIRFGKMGHAAVVDHTGRTLAHPLSDWADQARDLASVSVVQRMMAGETGVDTFYSPALKGDMIAGFTAVSGPGWGVMVPQPLVELEEAAAEIEQDGLVVLGAGLLLSIGLALWMAVTLGRRVGLVEDAAGRMADGDNEVRISKPRQSVAVTELENLRIAFNDMADQIEASHSTETKLRLAAEEASNAKSDFLANMTHEIRNPMNAIVGMAQYLQDSQLSDRQRNMANLIVESGQSLERILSDILDFSKAEQKQIDLALEPVNLGALAISVGRLMADSAYKNGVELLVDAPLSTHRPVLCDPGRVRQVLMNLLGNAVKFTERGYVRLNLRLKAVDPSHAHLVVEVQDTGIGIPTDRLSHVFRPFEQADAKTFRRFGGTGLGLAICRQIAESMKGVVSAESEVGQGSTFRFEAMLAIAGPEALASSDVEPQPVPPGLRGRRALIVDSMAESAAILAEILRACGIETEVEPSPILALSTLRQAAEAGAPFDLLVTDFATLGMTGEGLVRRVSEDGRLGQPRCVITCASVLHSMLPADIDSVARVLAKPVSMKDLWQAVGGLTAARSRIQQPEGAADAKGAVRTLDDNSASDGTPSTVGIGDGRGDQSRLNVLLVEDNYANRCLVEVATNGMPVNLRMVENGAEALDYLVQNPDVDMVLMDISMPIMDGVEATRRLRAIEQEHGLARHKVVGITALATAGVRKESMDAGMDDFVTKPLSILDLQRLVTTALAGKRSSPGAAIASPAS